MLGKSALATLAMATLVLGGPAVAQDRGTITAEQAIEIAKQQGLVTVEEVERDDGKWEVEGKDISGREIEVDIDARSGQVVKVERD
ncbi:PepSY domain-containing protein [Leptospira interrogans]